jgi:hypothetical protein
MAATTPNFLIRRGVLGAGTVSGLMPSTAQVIGIALYISDKDAGTGENTFAVATTSNFLGFATRATRTTTGSTDAELVDASMGISNSEMPFTCSKPGAVEFAEALEVEGSDYITVTGTGAITTGTSENTELTFRSGKFAASSSGETVFYKLVHVMTPATAGAVRIYVERVHQYLDA